MRMAVCLLAALVAGVPAAAQGPIEARGTVTHRLADAHFPERLGEFRRQNVHQFDGDGADVSASYWLVRGGDRLLVTIYIYPAGRMGAAGSREQQCQAEFEGVGAAIVHQNRTARATGEGAAPVADGVPSALAHRAVYSMDAQFDGRPQPVRSEAWLYCFVGGEWQVKYRATSNAGFDASAEIERLVRTGPWPGRAAPADPDEIAGLAPS